jgi:quercetin dioxygenase-like cupin family protein
MKRILCGICLVFFLFGSVRAENEGAVESVVLVKSGSSWDGKPLPRYAKGKPEVTIIRIIIPPGGRLPLHKHLVINSGVLIRGELTVVTENNEILHLKAGDPIVEVVNKWHYGRNDGDVPAEIIVVYAGIRGKPITIRK